MIAKLSILIFVLLSACSALYVEKPNKIDMSINEVSSAIDCVDNDVRFIIVSNEMRSSKTRHIQVFLDDKDFSLSNLQKLFSKLSSDFPEPKYLSIVVQTDWSQLSLSTDCPGSGISGNDSGRLYFFHTARFNRDSKRRTIHYTKDLNVDHLEIVEFD